MKNFDVSKFSSDRLVLEIRYGNAFLLWDAAGELWTELSKAFPKLEIVKGEPKITSFISDKKTEILVAFDHMRLVDHRAKPEDFIERCAKFAGPAIEILGIEELTRIGLRQILMMPFKSKEAIVDELVELGAIKDAGKFFGVEGGKTAEYDHHVRWESETLGALVRLRTHHDKAVMCRRDFGTMSLFLATCSAPRGFLQRYRPVAQSPVSKSAR